MSIWETCLGECNCVSAMWSGRDRPWMENPDANKGRKVSPLWPGNLGVGLN
jgi:hypothetical protein